MSRALNCQERRALGHELSQGVDKQKAKNSMKSKSGHMEAGASTAKSVGRREAANQTHDTADQDKAATHATTRDAAT